MGTNYYARIIPTHERKQELKKLIDSDDFRVINDEIRKTYGNFDIDYDHNPVGGKIHLGKHSGGWKFLWNPNIYIIHNGHIEWTDDHKFIDYVKDPDTYYYVYPLNKKGIKNFIDRPDIEIYDEYGEKQDKESFWNYALNCNIWNGREAWDSKTYNEYERSKNPNWTPWPNTGEYVNMLISQGFIMNSKENYDFYSDGLRFSTSIEFS